MSKKHFTTSIDILKNPGFEHLNIMYSVTIIC